MKDWQVLGQQEVGKLKLEVIPDATICITTCLRMIAVLLLSDHLKHLDFQLAGPWFTAQDELKADI